MGVSRQTKKPVSGKSGSSKTKTNKPRHAHSIRTVNSRPLPPRITHAQAAAQTWKARPTHRLLVCSGTPAYEQHVPHSDHQDCTFYCYFCYCCYCCCLTVLSVCLLLLLSPTPNSKPTSSFPLPTSCPTCSCFNLTAPAVPPFCPVPPCLISPLSYFDTSYPKITTSSAISSSSSSLLSLRHPLLCRPWPSSRSLSSLLLCPPSFGDQVLSYASTLEHIPTRPRTLLRQQSLQQPLIHPSSHPGLVHPPTTSQSLGQLHTAPQGDAVGKGAGGTGGGGGGGVKGGGGEGGGTGTRAAARGARGSPAGVGTSRYRAGAGGRSRANPGSWDYMMDQIRNRGLDVKSFL